MNLYDDFQPDVASLLKQQDAKLPAIDPAARSGEGLGPLGGLASRARLYALGALVRLGLHRRLVYANLRLGWFHEFQRYWGDELGNRPIHPHDFYFLAGVYRQRLQTIHFDHIEDARLASDDKHLEAWRDPRIVHHLFPHTFRRALSPLRVHPFIRWVPRAPDDDAPLQGSFDTVFCLETFEHLPRPLAVARQFHRVLKPRGCLVFDYIRSEGTGLDTAAALRDRIPALEFILTPFDVVQGRVTTDGA